MTPTKNESLPELPALSDAAIAAAWREMTAPVIDGDGIGQVVGVGVVILEKRARELEAAITREAPTEGVMGDVHVVAILRKHIEETAPDGPLEHVACHAMAKCILSEVAAATQPAPPRLAQGDDKVPGCEDCAYNGRFLCDTHGPAAQPPHHDRGEVEQRARELQERCQVSAAGNFKPNHAVVPLIDFQSAIRIALTEAKQQGPGEAVPVSALIALADRWVENSRKRALTSAVGAGIDRCVDDLRDLIAAAAKPPGEE